jgi:putative endonuclease
MRCGESDAVEPASFVYVIGAATARGYRTYVGWTLDPERRLSQHNGGIGAKSTRGFAWEMLYIEKFASREEAMSREWHLKQDRRFRKRLAGRLPFTAPRSSVP